MANELQGRNVAILLVRSWQADPGKRLVGDMSVDLIEARYTES